MKDGKQALRGEPAVLKGYSLGLADTKEQVDEVVEKIEEALERGWLTDKDCQGLTESVKDVLESMDDAESMLHMLDANLYDILGGEE